uniref:Uncharacterized protein n=1 Tax=Skeletonema marinoi TaxID=267567 RepID=A0A7S2M0W4_9STRA|mmetsp:Transcript_32305/g.54551  ORF Transcript_32305/g.54551 Transcript_32305/m.54551 type:complete len:406 (+) Transcript_32305:91-1308(+)
MDFNRSRSCPTDTAGRLGAAPPPAQFFDADDEFKFDDFKFDPEDSLCVSGKFDIVDEEADDKTVCSEPPKPSAVVNTRTYNNKKVPAGNSPTSVHQFLEQIPEDNKTKILASNSPASVHQFVSKYQIPEHMSEDEEDPKYNLSLREGYSVDKRKTSDITDVISNMEHGDSPKRNSSFNSRNSNLVVMGSLEKHTNAAARDKQQHPQQQQRTQPLPKKSPPRTQQLPKKAPPVSAFRRLFSCGAPEVITDFKDNVKQKGVDTVEEVKGSFGDLGLTVRQVFSPVQNTKTGAGLVKKKIVTKVQSFKGGEVDEEGNFTDEEGNFTDDEGNFTDDDDDNVTDDDDDNVTDDDDDDNVTDDDDEVDFDEFFEEDEESEYGSSFVGSESEFSCTDDESEGSYCKRVTSWK